MSSNVSCPDCNSQDIQEIVKTEQVMTSARNWKMFWIVLAGGLIFYLVGGILTGQNNIFLALSSPALFASVFILLFKKKSGIITKTYTHYVCRSCGREF